MSDHIEHKCNWCGSLLHHVEDCPSKSMSGTPRTDAAVIGTNISSAVFDVVKSDFARELERENNQLRADLKQCAEAMKEAQFMLGMTFDLLLFTPIPEAQEGSPKDMIDKALSLPSVQAALKEKEKEKEQ